MNDPIVDEVRVIRAQIAQECGFDLARIAEHARKAAERIPGLRYVTADELRVNRKQPERIADGGADSDSVD